MGMEIGNNLSIELSKLLLTNVNQLFRRKHLLCFEPPVNYE